MRRFVSFGLVVLMILFCNLSVFAEGSIQYSTKGGTWSKVGDSTYVMDNNGDAGSVFILGSVKGIVAGDFITAYGLAPCFILKR